MEIRFSREAREFLENQVDYLNSINPQASQRVFKRISLAVERLKDNPYSGKQSFIKNIREIIESKYNFKILYSVDGNVIYIASIFNTRMDAEKIYKSLE
ncbi:MAG: type II toxin-antitoxin system RelE/ParE family toxin [Magnetococcales bacterium]|nr:type II toxin-antitoxin system RelE/ParE family toxin [Magnetococcales bacterium]